MSPMAFFTLTLSRILQTFPSRSNTESIFKLGINTNKYVLSAIGICLLMIIGCNEQEKNVNKTLLVHDLRVYRSLH